MSAKSLDDDLNKMSYWAFQWEMSFNPDPNWQAQKVCISHKIKKSSHPSLFSNDSTNYSEAFRNGFGYCVGFLGTSQGYIQ